eukprot:Filipodium_phascolosomae@DN1707_c0_g1_i2.p1
MYPQKSVLGKGVLVAAIVVVALLVVEVEEMVGKVAAVEEQAQEKMTHMRSKGKKKLLSMLRSGMFGGASKEAKETIPTNSFQGHLTPGMNPAFSQLASENNSSSKKLVSDSDMFSSSKKSTPTPEELQKQAEEAAKKAQEGVKGAADGKTDGKTDAKKAADAPPPGDTTGPCASKPCNHGTCKNVNDKNYLCTCQKNWGPPNCSKVLPAPPAEPEAKDKGGADGQIPWMMIIAGVVGLSVIAAIIGVVVYRKRKAAQEAEAAAEAGFY